jgi:regulator of sigma E protease
MKIAVLSNIPYILIAVFMFGLLIFVHELGHFIMARTFNVKVNEFALGMGPTILKKKKGETVYALRALPVGGFCAMEGEDEDSEDPRAFGSKPIWQRCLILVAGAAMNFIMGLVILLILYAPVRSHIAPEISGFAEGFPYEGENMLMRGDTLKKINGYNIYTYSDVGMFLDRGLDGTYTFTVRRDGKDVQLSGVPLQKREYPTEVALEDGTAEIRNVLRYGIQFTEKSAGFFDKIRLAMLEALDFVRLIKVSLFDLFSGQASVSDMSGPVGIATIITTTAKTSFSNMWFLVALIAVNLGVMNLLPIPALDGGRVIFLVIEKIRRKPVNPKYEGMVHMASLAVLLLFMVYVSFNDIVRLVSG